MANFAGQVWAALMQLAFIPLYIKFLGIEAYGLIGFYATLQGLLQILDFGLSPTMNRELARYSATRAQAGETRDFVRTLEIGYWVIGLAIGVVIFAFAPAIANHWIKPLALPASAVRQAVMTMGLIAALQWPLTLYQGGLLGLQRQTLLNVIKISISTLSGGGAALILWLVSPTITAFFDWQAAVSALQVVLFTLVLWRCLPRADHRPRFEPELLLRIWRFAAGVSGITLTGLVLMQLDKLILSKMLSLEMFGYYALSGMVANGLYVTITPIFNALFPKFSALVADDDVIALTRLYHRAAQLMAALTLPLAAVLALFPLDVLLLWTHDLRVAQQVAPIVRLLVIGTGLNALMNMPYALQLAYGWTTVGLRINTFLIVILAPTTFWMAAHFGAIGAAAVWVAINAIYMLIGIPLTHRRLLRGQAWRWLAQDVTLPLIATLATAGTARWLIQSPLSPVLALFYFPLVLLATLAAAVLAAPEIRASLFDSLATWRFMRPVRTSRG